MSITLVAAEPEPDREPHPVLDGPPWQPRWRCELAATGPEAVTR